MRHVRICLSMISRSMQPKGYNLYGISPLLNRKDTSKGDNQYPLNVKFCLWKCWMRHSQCSFIEWCFHISRWALWNTSRISYLSTQIWPPFIPWSFSSFISDYVLVNFKWLSILLIVSPGSFNLPWYRESVTDLFNRNAVWTT